MRANQILEMGKDILKQRGTDYDKKGKGEERSMDKVVAAFNTLTGHKLTTEQGWLFMVLLKVCRSQQGVPKLDNFVDGANYFALAGEEALTVRP